MLVIGLTGGIGSGKSTVAKLFEQKGIAVYNSDNQAKTLMNTDKTLKQQIIQLFGVESYNETGLNRAYLAQIVFPEPEKLKQLTALVHPAVAKDFANWIPLQKGFFVMNENAVLFESGSYNACHKVITVLADDDIRITRTISRDNSTKDQILDRMKNQWTDQQRQEKANYCIYNTTTLKQLKIQVDEIYKIILADENNQ